ncbi:MAG TPA: AraC family transcriptional regulator [Solirubrobacterales bacterium]|nr:AraC family transcriptional regulator [Solirubrobacterales bacterium]
MTLEELENLALLRRARDLMDREYARPLDVPALARAALMSTAHFSRQFRAAYGETPYAYLMTTCTGSAAGRPLPVDWSCPKRGRR